jgi:propanol-preferring alcohol dehydrogenase
LWLSEAAAVSQREASGLVECSYTTAAMEEINDVFGDMRAGKIDGRVVLKIK